MKKLSHTLVVLFLVFLPAAQSKPLSSNTESDSKEIGDENVDFSNTKISTPKDIGHNNLLSDLARISKDEETGTKKTIVGTESSAATVRNNSTTESGMVTSAPTETQSTPRSYFTSPRPTSGDKAATKADNDLSLVRLSEPTHIILNKNKDEGNSFSKLITSNDYNIPADEAKTNDAASKPQALSPLISERTENNGDSKDSDITASPSTPSSSTPSPSTVSPPPASSSVTATVNKPKQQNSMDDGVVSDISTESPKKVQDDTVKNEAQKDASTAGDHVIVCAGEKQTISCPSDTTLDITSAQYGYTSNSGCPGNQLSPSCSANGVYPVIRSACQGQASCLLQSDGQEFGGMCPGKNNYLKVGYSCQNDAPQSSAYVAPSAYSSTAAAAPQPSPNQYSYQTSPYIPHPVSNGQTSYYNYAYNQANSNNVGYMNDNRLEKPNYPYYGNYGNSNYGNQGYYNYYNQGGPSQGKGNYYRYKSKSPPQRKPALKPQQRPQPPRNNYAGLAQYRDYNNRYRQQNTNRFPQQNTNRYPQQNSYYDSRNRYYDQWYSQYTQPYTTPSQYPRNSYTGSCYACQNCQQCSEQAYCQGCPKCKKLPCNKKRPKEERYMDPIDSLVEEFGKKTKGMTPMEMSAVVISPAPKFPEIAHSLPLRPPPKALEEDDNDDDDDDDSDENEFTLSEGEGDNHEIAEYETQKKTSVSPSKSSSDSTKDKSSKKKEETASKKSNIEKKPDSSSEKDPYDDDDDEDGYDLKVFKNLMKKKPRRKSRIHRHHHHRQRKHARHHLRYEDERRKRLSKRWFDEDENLANEANQFDIDQSEKRHVESPYFYYPTFW